MSIDIIPPRRRWRKLLIALASLLALLILLIALAPTLITWGIGQGFIRSAINNQIRGTVTLGDLSLGWFSTQSVRGLKIDDEAGRNVATIDLNISAGLWRILRGAGPINITVAGAVNGQVREDGSISFADLAVQQPPSQPAQHSPSTSQPFRLPQLPETTVDISKFTITLDLKNVKPNQTVIIDQLTGKLAFVDPTQPITIDIHSRTLANGTQGSTDITGRAVDLFDSNGSLTLRGASAKLDVQAASIPLPIAGQSVNVQSFSLSIASDDLTGRIICTTKIDAQATGGGYEPSHAEINASLNNILTTSGELSLRNGSASVSIEARQIPILDSNVKGQVRSLSATLLSDDLTKSITAALQSEAQLEGQQPSTLNANIKADELLAPDGKLTFDTGKLTGSVRGKTVPTAIVEPFLKSIPIVVQRDIGPTVDIDADFGAGAARDISLTAVGQKARLEVKGNVDPATGAINGTHLLVSAPSLDPQLIKELASTQIDRHAGIELRLTRFAIPPTKNAADLAKYALTGTVNLTGPFNVVLLADSGANATSIPAPELAFNNLNASIDTPALGQVLRLDATTAIDGATITINQAVTNLFDQSGKLSPLNALPVGTIRVENLSASTLAKFAPAQKELIADVLEKGLNASVTTAAQGSSLNAEIQVNAKSLESRISATRLPDKLHVESALVNLTVSPALAAALQKDRTDPIVLGGRTPISLDISQIDFRQTAPGKYELADQPIVGILTVNDAVIQKAPSLAEPIAVRNLVAQLSKEREGSYQSFAIKGDVTLYRAAGNQLISRARYDAHLKTKQVDQQPREYVPHLDLGLTDLSVANLETLLGKEPGALSQWTGDSGHLTASIDPDKNGYKATLHSQLPNIEGDFNAFTDLKSILLTGETTSFTLSRATLESRLNATTASTASVGSEEDESDAPPPPKPSKTRKKPSQKTVAAQTTKPAAKPPVSIPAAPGQIKIDADVPMHLQIRKVQLPLAMMMDQSFDPASAAIDIQLTGGPLNLTNPDGARMSMTDLVVSASSANLDDGINFSLKSSAGALLPHSASGTSTQPATQPRSATGALDVSGKLIDLITEDMTFELQGARVQLDAKATEAPTAIADVIINMQGLLVAALGGQMNATLKADDLSLSFTSGELDARIDAPNGWLELPTRGKDHSLRTIKGRPIAAELNLSPELRDRLLYKIHPILADIRTTEQPLRVKIPSAVVPTDGDISRLRADMEITIGKVELDSGSTTLKLLNLFGQAEKRATIPGEIEPIMVKIRKGVVRYDKFAVRIGKLTLNYSGEIDLVKKTVDLRTEVPLQSLAKSIRELEPYADKIAIPIVTRGPLGGKLKTRIDPKFDIGKAALDAGVKGGLDDLLKRGLDDLLGGDKD